MGAAVCFDTDVDVKGRYEAHCGGIVVVRARRCVIIEVFVCCLFVSLRFTLVVLSPQKKRSTTPMRFCLCTEVAQYSRLFIICHTVFSSFTESSIHAILLLMCIILHTISSITQTKYSYPRKESSIGITVFALGRV